MNEIVNKFLLTLDKFMPKLYLRKPGFTYNACEPFTKHHNRIQSFKETGAVKYMYKNILDKSCFVHDVVYVNSKDLAKRTVSDKICQYRAYTTAVNPKYNRYQRRLASMV